MKFESPTKGWLDFDGVVDEIAAYFIEDQEARYSLVVGTDSDQALEAADFVTAIVVHRRGKGARYFLARERKPRYHTLRERIWQEAIFSTTIAKSLAEELLEREVPSQNVEVHIDVGENGPTRSMIKELVGFVRGNGFVAQIKPEAYAAASVADRYT